MIQYYFNIPNLDNAYWTLVIELIFYVLIYILLVTKRLNSIHLFGCMCLILVAINTFVLKNNYPEIHTTINHYFPLINYFSLFFAGILFYKLKVKQPVLNVFTTYLLIFICLALQGALYVQAVDIWSITFYQYLTMLCIYFLLFILFINNNLSFLVSKPTLYLGSISYALYLIHQIISIDYILPFLIGDLNWSYWLSALTCVLVAVSLASVITFYIEKPLGEKLKHWRI